MHPDSHGPPGLSLRTQLLCTIVGSIVATAVALTTLAYRAQVSNLEDDARRAVHVAAQSRASAIERLIDGQQQRAQRFLIAAASLCGEETPSGGIAWELGCAQRALRELRASEHAIGALLTNRRSRIAASGVAIAGRLPIPTPLARLVERDGQMTYVIVAQMDDAAVRVQFGLADLSALLEQPFGLGATGDLFLRDSSGILLTSRPGTATFPASLGESRHSCAAGPSEWSELDYRGTDTIHGVHPVSGFALPICVDAHLSHEEALVPAGKLLVDLLTPAALFAAMGGVLALFAAHWMTAPVQRLAASARALRGGDFARPIPTGGPSEVRALAEALARMARALGEQMTLERSARQEAETANHAKDEFLAVLSHELSTPLTSTLGWTRLLRGGRLDAVKADRAIAAIERSTQKQQRLVEDLLDVSRIIAGRLRLDLIVVQLNDLVGGVLEQLGLIAEEKGVALESIIEATPLIKADPLRFQQIVTNLVFNAIKFTAPGGRVTIRVREVDDCVEIGVFDTGIGIAAEFLPRVFEPFQQADAGPRRAYGGLGLGLSIVHHLVRLHGGEIEATSMGAGSGASFVVRLPLLPNAVSEILQGGARLRSAV